MEEFVTQAQLDAAEARSRAALESGLRSVQRDGDEHVTAVVERALTTVGVQIGAVERTLLERIKSLKAWGIAAVVSGQALAGLLAGLVAKNGTEAPGQAVATAARLLGLS